jgi:hypothetical protein
LRDVLRTVRPFVKAEIYKHLPSHERAEFYNELRDLGYRLFRCHATTYRGEELGRDDIMRWRHFDVFAIPDELA